jgi:hypothetical protein
MKYRAVKVGDEISVFHNGTIVKAAVDRVGPVQGQGWAMLTLNIGGNIAFVSMHESELANPVRAGQGNYSSFAEAVA